MASQCLLYSQTPILIYPILPSSPIRPSGWFSPQTNGRVFDHSGSSVNSLIFLRGVNRLLVDALDLGFLERGVDLRGEPLGFVVLAREEVSRSRSSESSRRITRFSGRESDMAGMDPAQESGGEDR